MSPRISLLALTVALTACDDSAGPLGPVEAPCGVRDCSVSADDGALPAWQDPDNVGKADAAGVESAINAGIADGVLDVADVEAAFEAAGNRVGRREMEFIGNAVASTTFEVTPDARARALFLASRANLFDVEAEDLDAGRTAAGTEIPEKVTELIARARLNGALAYDVRDTNNDGEGVWTHYPATSPPVENMAFDYTEVTPAALAEDMAATDLEYNAIVGNHTDEFCNAAGCTEFQVATLQPRKGGTGNVLSHYDEVFHEDIFARGSQGQKWANNCAILTDGSLHCLPAARRSVLQDVILTNPALSRCNDINGFVDECRHLLYHGHIDIRNGVVTGIEVSGRPTRRIAKGQATLVDPLAVLEAWGFEIAPGARIRWGNTNEGVPVRDLEGGVIRAAQ
ncbi:MAG: hypothetical protein AAF721_17075 [Myxococcota bacterium]